jgi:hypothetical protein
MTEINQNKQEMQGACPLDVPDVGDLLPPA